MENALDAETAQSLGFYDQAHEASEERKALESQLTACHAATPTLASAKVIRQRLGKAFDDLETVLACATVEEKRSLITSYC